MKRNRLRYSYENNGDIARFIHFCRFAVLLVWMVAAAACSQETDKQHAADIKITSGAQTTADAARIAFQALKINQFDKYRVLLATADDMEKTFHLQQGKYPDKLAKLKNMFGDKDTKELVHTYLEHYQREELYRFSKIRSKAAKDLDWDSAQFAGLIESLSVQNTEGDPPVTWCNIHFLVESQGVKYRFLINDAFRSERGWLSGLGLRYKGKLAR